MAAMMKKVLIYAALLIGFLLFYKMLFPTGGSEMMGKLAPNFEVNASSGEKFVLNDHLGKDVILVNIWATWCAPCREEIPVLNDMFDELPKEGFILLSLMEDELSSVDQRVKALKNFNKKIPVKFPVYFDIDGLVADLYGTYRIPESFIINKEGKVVYFHEGSITSWDKKALMKFINKLIQS